MANELPDGLGSESTCISGSFSSEITHYLLVVVGEPLSQEYVDPALADVEKALQCWDVDDSAIGYDSVLQATAAADVHKVGLVHRSLAHCGTSVGVVILVNPTSSEVTAELRNLLIHPASNKHLIFGGHWLEGSGDWVLHNDTFTLHDIAAIFSEPEVDAAVLKASQDDRQTLVVSGCRWQTAAVTKQTFTKSLNLTINPQEVKNAMAGISLVLQTIRNNIQIPSPFELLEPPTMGVGVKCKITKPTVLIFPAGKGDCAFFAVTDFSIFLGGGYCTKSCFWKFAKHLHRIDAIMAQHMQPDSLVGFNSLLKRKIAEQQLTEPEKGSEEYEDWLIKCNSPEVGVVYLNAPENKKSATSLQLKTVSQGNLTQQLLQELEIKPFSCTANIGKIIEPVTLYQKVGIGRLDMFILTPVHDSKELKDFMQQWSGNKAFSKVKIGMKVNGKESEYPISSAVSICALIVWQPANPHEDIVKVLFPGNAPQTKILEGLDRLKHLDYLKYPHVTAAKLTKGGAPLKKKSPTAGGKTPPKANGPTASVTVTSSNEATCTDGIHCGTPPPEVQGECTDGKNCNTPPPCPDGLCCGTPPPDGKCKDGLGCNTPPPDTEQGSGVCSDGKNCNTPPPEEGDGQCCDGKHCGTPPPENEYDEDACNKFVPIEPYKCTDGANCNTPPPEGDVMFTDGNHCNTPPPEDDGVMDTQESPVDNEPQATVQGDICGNLMDSNLPESQQDMGAFVYVGTPDAFDNKQSDAPERLASGEITPSDQVEYGDESPNDGSFVFEAEAGSKVPAPVPSGFGDYAEEDHVEAAAPGEFGGGFEKKRDLSDDESPTNGNQGSGAFDDESGSPNGGPHPWEPRIEFSSPDQEPDDSYLVEEPRPEADFHEEQIKQASFPEIPPPVVPSNGGSAVEEMEAQASSQEYAQDVQYEQQEDIADDEEEDSSEASQASEIEVKPDQQLAEAENQMMYEEPAPVSQMMPEDSQVAEDGRSEEQGQIPDVGGNVAEMEAKDQEISGQFDVTSEEPQPFQGLGDEETQYVMQPDVQQVTEQEVAAGESEQLQAEIRGEPVVEIQSSEGQEEVLAGREEEEHEEMETGHAESVESPAPEEDQDQVVPEGEYEEYVPPPEVPVTEAWSQEGQQEINQNFMIPDEFSGARAHESLQPEEIGSQPAEISPEAEEISPKAEEISPEETSPDAEEISPEAEEISPEAEEISPDAEEISPEAEEISPDAEEISPDVEEISPGAEEISPGAEEISPDSGEISPDAEAISPEAEEICPDAEDISPQPEDFSPQPDDISPQPEKISPLPEEVSPQPEEISQEPGENSQQPEEISLQPEADINENRQIAVEEVMLLEETSLQPEAEAVLESSERDSEDLVQFGDEVPPSEPASYPYQSEDMEQVAQEHPQVIQREPEEGPETVEEYSPFEPQDVPSTLISESVSDTFTQPPVPAQEAQQEIIGEPVPDYDVEAAYNQEVIQEESSIPDQQSSSEPLLDSLSEPQSEKEPDSLSEPHIDVEFEEEATKEGVEPVEMSAPAQEPSLSEPHIDVEFEEEATKEEVEPVEMSAPAQEPSPSEPEPEPIKEPSPQPSPELQHEPVVEPSLQPTPESNLEPQPLMGATEQSAEPEPEPKPAAVPEIAAKPASSVSTTTKVTTKTSTTTSSATKKPADKGAKTKGTTKTTTRDIKTTTKTKTSVVTEKKSTTKTPGTKKLEVTGAAKRRTTGTEPKAAAEKKTPTERKTPTEKRTPTEKKTFERKSLAERKTVAAEKKPSRLSAMKTPAARPQTSNRDKSPGKVLEKHAAASVSTSSSSHTSRTKTNGSGDTKPTPTKRLAPSQVTTRTTPKASTQRPTGSKAPSSARKSTEPAKRESDRFTRSAPSKAGDSRKSDSSKRPLSSKTSTSTSKAQAIPISGPSVYVDLTYIPHHASEDSVNMEFFRRIRSKNYVLSANDKGRNQPSMTVMDSLLEAKSKWEDPEAEVTVIPTYDTDALQEWEQKNVQQLSNSKITISQPASRSIVQMKDENFFMYKVEF